LAPASLAVEGALRCVGLCAPAAGAPPCGAPWAVGGGEGADVRRGDICGEAIPALLLSTTECSALSGRRMDELPWLAAMDALPAGAAVPVLPIEVRAIAVAVVRWLWKDAGWESSADVPASTVVPRDARVLSRADVSDALGRRLRASSVRSSS